MYEAFFDLHEKPFSLLPDPGFLFLSQKHQEALTLLEYGLLNQAGFIVLTGEIGSGKTTLMRYLLDRLDTDVTVGLISNTHQSLGDLIHWICLAFDIRVTGGTKLDLHQAFVEFLIDRYANGKRVLLIVDEAQNLGVEKLEELRLLSNINAGKDLILQLMLLGQPQLRDLLRHADLEQFVQRISASYHLGRLDAQETKNYIQHRIFIAGGRYPIFSNDACHAVHHYSGGIPRIINLICDTALVYAYGANEKRITGTAIDEFIATHANHLLIPIDGYDSAHPVPRQRLDDPGEQAIEEEIDPSRTPADPTGAGTIARAAEINPVSISRSPTTVFPEAASISPKQTDTVSSSSTASEHIGRPTPAVRYGSSTNDEALPSTASALQVPDVPASTAESEIAGALGAGSRKPNPAEPTAAKSVRESTSRFFIVAEPPESPHDKKRRKWPGILAVIALLLATIAAAVWFGGSSVSEHVRTTILEWIGPNQESPAETPAPAPSDQPSSETEGSIVPPPAPRPEQSSIPASSVARPPGSLRDSLDRGEDAPPAGSENPADEREKNLAEPKPPLESAHGAMASDTNEQLVTQPGDRGDGAARPLDPKDLASDDLEARVTSVVPRANPDSMPPRDPAPEPPPAQDTDAIPKSAETTAAPTDRTDEGPFAALEDRLKQLSIEIERQGDLLTADLGRSVRFADGSAELNAAARQNLRQIADALKDVGGIRIRVVGHTDSSGTESVNQWLSARRAGVVAGFLSDQGVPAGRLDHEGRGHAEPKLDADQERTQGSWVNRRIELEVSAAPIDSE
jgi:general secretion pathway protein A